jgi:tRNA A37 threonylcarbamoyladenosine dehydratase
MNIDSHRAELHFRGGPRTCLQKLKRMAKTNVLVVGMGGLGVIAAVNLEAGGQATVSAVVRSAYDIVSSRGYMIDACDHGKIESWRPTTGY